MQLRKYQNEVVNGLIKAFRAGESKSLVSLFCSAGKTIIFSALVSSCEEIMNSVRVIIVVPKNILVMQTFEKLSRFVSPDKISFYNAGIGVKDINAQYVIASIQSLANCSDIPTCNLFLIDECHVLTKAHKTVYERLLEKNDKLRCVGFTATVNEAEKFWPKPMVYKDLKWAVDNNYACPLVLQDGHASARVDLSGVKIVMGDYVQNQLAPKIEEKIKDQVADAMAKSKARKKIAWICLSIEHAEIVTHLIPERSVIIHSRMKKKDRLHNIDVFEHTNCRHLVSVMQVSIGYDYPALDCLVLLRPTRSKQLYIQAVGRIARLCDGKTSALFLDYGQVVENLGNPYYVRFDGEIEKKEAQEMACPMCDFFTPRSEDICSHCGYHFHVMCDHCGTLRKKGTSCGCRRSNITWKNSLKNLTDGAHSDVVIIEVKWLVIKTHTTNALKKCWKVEYNNMPQPMYYRKDLQWMMRKLYILLKGFGVKLEDMNEGEEYRLPRSRFAMFKDKELVNVEDS